MLSRAKSANVRFSQVVQLFFGVSTMCAQIWARVFCGMRIGECGKLSRGNLRKI